MAILITMPVKIYDGLLSKCAMLSREYLILRNGVVRRDLAADDETLGCTESVALTDRASGIVFIPTRTV